MGKNKVTIKDIANYAGVTSMTVSYVLNKNPNQTISEETTKKVLEAAEKLRYIPNNAAKALRSRQTLCIGVALEKTLIVYRYAQVLEGIRSGLEENGYRMFLCSSQKNKNNLPDYLNCYMENIIDGLIYVGRDGMGIEEEYASFIKKNGIPVVGLDCENMDAGISSVDYDYYDGAYNHTEYLINKGAKRIIYIRPGTETRQEKEREKGFCDAVRKYSHVEFLTRYLENPLKEEKEITRITGMYDKEILELFSGIVGEAEKHKYDAVLCSWGGWVEPVYAEAIRRGLSLEVAGLAEGALFYGLWENVSYSVLPNYEAGDLCVEILMEQLREKGKVRKEMLKPVRYGGGK